jgi:hypothetical protein
MSLLVPFPGQTPSQVGVLSIGERGILRHVTDAMGILFWSLGSPYRGIVPEQSMRQFLEWHADTVFMG